MFMFVLLYRYRVCTHVRLGMLATILCGYVFVIVKGMYTCKSDNFGNERLYLCFSCCIGYEHM